MSSKGVIKKFNDSITYFKNIGIEIDDFLDEIISKIYADNLLHITDPNNTTIEIYNKMQKLLPPNYKLINKEYIAHITSLSLFAHIYVQANSTSQSQEHFSNFYQYLKFLNDEQNQVNNI